MNDRTLERHVPPLILSHSENALVDTLQSALRIDGDLARKIVDVLLIKNRASGRPDR